MFLVDREKSCTETNVELEQMEWRSRIKSHTSTRRMMQFSSDLLGVERKPIGTSRKDERGNGKVTQFAVILTAARKMRTYKCMGASIYKRMIKIIYI